MKSVWLKEKRKDAEEKLKELKPPTTKDEVWRYSDIDELDLEAYSQLGERDSYGEIASGDSAEKYLESIQKEFGEISGLLLSQSGYFLGGWNSEEISQNGILGTSSGGFFAGAMDDAAHNEEILRDLSKKSVDYFSTMNDAYMKDPLCIHIPAGFHLEKPICVLELADIDEVKIFPRLLVHLGEGASAKVIHVFRSSGGANFSVPVVDLFLSSYSNLDYLCVEDLGEESRQIGFQSAVVESQANLSLNTIGLGGESVRFRTDCKLQGRGASGDILSLYFANKNQNFDFRTFQKHSAPDTNSNLLFKGAVDDYARLVYSGMIRIDDLAKSSNAVQANHNLKLSKDAWVESVPNLEIENNDVACSHASTVGPVDEDQRFYLESRGITTGESERLIVAGFFKEALSRLPFEAAIPNLYQHLVSRVSTSSHFSAGDKNADRENKG